MKIYIVVELSTDNCYDEYEAYDTMTGSNQSHNCDCILEIAFNSYEKAKAYINDKKEKYLNNGDIKIFYPTSSEDDVVYKFPATYFMYKIIDVKMAE